MVSKRRIYVQQPGFSEILLGLPKRVGTMGNDSQAYCINDNEPMKVVANFIKGIHKRIVKVEVIERALGKACSSSEESHPTLYFFKSIYENQIKNGEIRDKALLKCLSFNRFQFLTTNFYFICIFFFLSV